MSDFAQATASPEAAKDYIQNMLGGAAKEEPVTPAPEQEDAAEELDEAGVQDDENSEDKANDEIDDGEDDAGEDDEEDDDEEEPKGHMVPKSRLDAKNRKIDELQSQYDELFAFVKSQLEQGGKKATNEEEEFEPLDEDAWKKGDEKLTKAQQEAEFRDFALAIQLEEIKAQQKYPDFDDAFSYYQNFLVETIKEDAPHLKEAQVNELASQQLQRMAFQKWKQGQSPAEYMYKRAQRFGFAGGKQGAAKKSEPDFDAIERNRKKTEKKPTDTRTPTKSMAHKNNIAFLKSKMKPGEKLSIEKYASLVGKNA